jgi:hypothetical protein
VAECITIRLTPEQQEAIRAVTGREARTLTIPVDQLGDRVAEREADTGANEDALVWECLNPYP